MADTVKITKEQLRILESLQKTLGEINRNELKNFEKGWERTGKEVKKFDGMKRGLKDFARSFRGIGGRHNQMLEMAQGAKKFSAMLRLSGRSISQTKMGIAGMGKAMTGFGRIVGKVGKMLGGWPGLIAAVVTETIGGMYRAAKRVDSFVKNANKAFAYLRGPDIMTNDVDNQFKEFNDRLYSIRENLRVGLDAEQIKGFLESVVQAGTHLNRLNEGMMDYRNAVYIAAKASRTMGMELPMVGRLVGELISDFRMNLEHIDRSFVQVAFEAKKAGLTADRFFTAVQNATASLAMYGIFVDSATKSMRAFSESQVVGSQEAAKATEEMFQTFKRGSLETNAALVAMAKKSGFSFTKAFKDAKEDMLKRAGELETEIQANVAAGIEIEEIDKLRKEQARYFSMAERFEKASRGNEVEMASELAALTKEAPEILSAVLKGAAGIANLSDIDAKTMPLMMKVADAMKISEDLMRTLVYSSQAAREELERVVGVGKSGALNQKSLLQVMKSGLGINEKNLRLFTETMDKMDEMDPQQQIDATNKIAEQLAKTGKMDESSLKVLIETARADKDFANALNNYFKASLKQDEEAQLQAAEQIALLSRSGKVADKLALQRHKESQKTQDELEKNTEKTFDKIVDQTMTFEEMEKISVDAAKWRAVQLGHIQDISRTLTAWYKKRWEVKGTPQQMAQMEKARKLAGVTGSEGVTPENISGIATISAKMERSASAFLQGFATKGAPTSKEYFEALDKLNKPQLKLWRNLDKDLRRASGIQDDLIAEIASGNKDSEKAAQLQADLKELLSLIVKKTTTEDIPPELIKMRAAMGDLNRVPEDMKKQLELMKTGMIPILEESVQEQKNSRIALSQTTDESREIVKKAVDKILPKVSKQGLITPMTVGVSAMPALLHRGETVMPAHVAGGGGAGRNITININATERDLAKRIANEVRGVLYQQQLTGMA